MAATRKPLSEQIVVMAGACGGIGLCTARMAGLQGATLVFVSPKTTSLDSLVALVESTGGSAWHVPTDLCRREQVVAAAEAASRRFGRIDTWINTAGLSIMGRLDEVSEADSRRLFEVNFWSVVNGSLAALPHLVAAGGSLINVGSEVGQEAAAWQGLYASSKQAVRGFTDALRMEIEEADAAPVSIAMVEPAGACGSGVLDPVQVAEAILQLCGGVERAY
jgi:NADP-dependent 3-hydroxy acid dehydrogenase YdfG